LKEASEPVKSELEDRNTFATKEQMPRKIHTINKMRQSLKHEE